MARWKIHKLGFLNFWLYDEEEFILDDGHILLRGNNASGKSITTQSFIPFLLDGNRRPERFDSFGSRDRKMEFYLLGDDEREDSTGYLYLEFRKPDVEEYLRKHRIIEQKRAADTRQRKMIIPMLMYPFYGAAIRPPSPACQPDRDSPKRTGRSVWRSVLPDLGIAFCDSRTGFSRRQRHAPLWSGRMTSLSHDV